MAIAYIKTHGTAGSNTSATTLAFTPASTIPVGNYLIMGIASSVVGNTVTVTDTKSNTYQVDLTTSTTARVCYIVSCKLTTQLLTSDTITATFASSATGRMMSVDEYSGLHGTTWKGNTANATGTSTTPNSTGVVTTGAGALLYGTCVFANAGVTYAPGTTNGGAYAYTETNELKLAAANGLETEHYLNAANSLAVDANGTITSTTWTQNLVIYLPAAALTTNSRMFEVF